MKTRTRPWSPFLLAGAAVLLVGAGGSAPPARQSHEGHQHGSASPSEPAKDEAAAPGNADDWKQGTVTTIVAEVMDPACYLEAGAKSIGPGHFQCAVDCARSGQTLALLDRKIDRIYFIAGELPGRNPNDPVMGFIHKKVDVRGKVFHRSGAWGIVILSVSPHRDAPAGTAPGGSGRAKGKSQ